MATRIYFSTTEAATVSPAFDVAWEQTSSALRRRCYRSRVGSIAGTVVLTEIVATTPYDMLAYQFVSDPLRAQTIAGNVKGQIRASESSASSDSCHAINIRVCNNAGSAFRGTLLADFPGSLASEFVPSTATNRNFPISTALTPLDIQEGDRLVIEIGARHFNSSTSTLRSTIFIQSNGYVDLPEDETWTQADDPWIEFSQDIAFQANEAERYITTLQDGFDTLPSTVQSPTSFSGGTLDPKNVLRRGHGIASSATLTATFPAIAEGDTYVFRFGAFFTEPLVGQVIPKGTVFTFTQSCRISTIEFSSFNLYRVYYYILGTDGIKRQEIGFSSSSASPGTSFIQRSVTLTLTNDYEIRNGERIGAEIEVIYIGDIGGGSGVTWTGQFGRWDHSFWACSFPLQLATAGIQYVATTADFQSAAGDTFWDRIITPPYAISSITIKHKLRNDDSGSKRVIVGIYSNSAGSTGDLPNALVLAGEEKTIAQGANGEVTFTIRTDSLTPNTKYWLAVQYEGVFTVYYAAPDPGTFSAVLAGTYGVWPSGASATQFPDNIDHSYVVSQPYLPINAAAPTYISTPTNIAAPTYTTIIPRLTIAP